ncbi:glycerophosphodiester phosphodiesterase domain-containing protein 5-like [Amphiura filiformis]|uniref:glycerophosphodiester phosphodiesterase domain-containing protein 5-like n=1 Tax=Amphiura filiformis TaxID=82378 RepID=UPI003B21CAC8
MGCGTCCSSCVTCCYGCRCKKQKMYQKEPTKFMERLWFVLILLTFLVTLTNMYLWLVAQNDAQHVDTHVWSLLGFWFWYYTVLMSLSCAAFAYTAFLLIFALLHISLGKQLRLHIANKIGILLSLSVSVGLIVLTILVFPFLWHFFRQSLHFTGPFLHLFGIVTLTALSWYVAGGLGTLKKRGLPVRDIGLWYFLLLAGLYIAPVFINSPCFVDYDKLPEKPLIFAHRGAEELAPENTEIAFEIALNECNVHGIETDIRISFDGIPYVFHDNNLQRTTNVNDVFPLRHREPSDNFTMEELRELNAGSWFLSKNPYATVRELSEDEKTSYRSQKIMTMKEMFSLVLRYNRTLLLDVRQPPAGHPFHHSWMNVTLANILEAGVHPDDLEYWQSQDDEYNVVFIKTYDQREMVTLYNDVAFDDIKAYKEQNMTTNVWTVNTGWFFSLFWCAGSASVTSSSCQRLQHIEQPYWQLSPAHYLIVWILFDAVSFIWVLIIFVIQISRKHKGKRYQNEEPPERYNYRQFMALEDMNHAQNGVVL